MMVLYQKDNYVEFLFRFGNFSLKKIKIVNSILKYSR